MSTIDRMMRDRDRMNDEPLEIMGDGGLMEIVGAASDDVSKYLPLASSALSEVVSSQLKSKEDAQKQAAFNSSDAGKAQQAAKDIRLKASLAAADATAETDPNGPKHEAAQDLALQASAAEAKAAVYSGQPGAAQAGAAGALDAGGKGHHGVGGESFFEKYKWPIIGVGGFVGLGLIVLIARRR